ncbi:MAG: hypothetical protein R2708_00745 [Vicinamibacterales bacterium]
MSVAFRNGQLEIGARSVGVTSSFERPWSTSRPSSFSTYSTREASDCSAKKSGRRPSLRLEIDAVRLGRLPLTSDWVSPKKFSVRVAPSDAFTNCQEPETVPVMVLTPCVALYRSRL